MIKGIDDLPQIYINDEGKQMFRTASGEEIDCCETIVKQGVDDRMMAYATISLWVKLVK